MGKNSRMQNHINEIKRKTQYFWSHKGKRFCAAMLCASMVMGNAGSIANASNVIVSGESSLATPSNTVDTATPSNGNELHRFQLTGEELYEALQNAIAGDARADVEFTGGSSAEYEDFFLEPGDYYELNLENGKKGNRTELRIFARIEESELVEGERDDYVIDGTEELMLLAVNRSEKDQKVTVAVDEKHTPEFVIPVNVKSDAELITSPSPVIDTTKTGEEAETATPSNGMPATPSDSEEVETEIPEEKPADELEGEIYELTSVEEGTAVGFLTTTGSLGLDDMSLIATDSNALTRYSMPVDGAENILVDVTAKRGTIPEGAELRARYLTEDGNEYQDVKNALDEANEEYGGMMALDIGFWLNDEEIEPEPGSEVQVKIRMDANLLPDDVDVGTLKVQHHAETDQGIRIETVAKAVTVEEDETAAVPMTMSLMSLNADAVPLEEEILDDVIIEEADPENPVETIMDTVNAEPGTLKVIETDGEAAVVETAFVVDGFSKFTITWRSGDSKITVKYVNEKFEEINLNPEKNDKEITLGTSFKMSDYIVTDARYKFQVIQLNNKDGETLLTTKKSDNIYPNTKNGSVRLYYKKNNENYVISNGSTIYLVYESEPLPTFQGEDTSDLIQIQLFDYNEYQKVTDNFVFGGNGYTGGQGGGVKQGLVKPLLKNGYPVLKEDNKSLSCLFSKDGDYVQSGSYRNANYLLQQNPEDYAYYYDSNTNFASVDENGDFVLYETARYPDETTPPSEPKFLPYNTIINKVTTLENVYDGDPDKGERYREYAIGNGETENFGFGMTIDFDFIMPKDGKINGNDMVFNFQGDDDVWVFIDDVLVLDLGGVHDNYEGSINFQTGAVYVEKVNGTGNPQNTTISAMFQKAEKSWDASDYKNHELKFFYLERGRGGSNCTIEFNMPPIPKGTINFQKEIAYSNVKDVSDIDFKFRTFVNYGGTSSESDYKLYTGPYEVYNASDFDNPVKTETEGDGIILLKDDQMARLTDSAIQATSKYYIQEIGATSDKFDVSIDGVNVEIIYEDGSTTEELGVETDKLSVDNNPYVVFKNSVSADNMFNLRIDKVMSDGSRPDAEFKIKVLLGLEDKKPYTGEYQVWEDGKREATKTASEEGILTLKAGQYAIITGLMGGNKITVQETEYGGRKAPTYVMTGPLAAPAVTGDNSISATAKEGKELGTNATVQVTVTNYPLPGLTVSKTVNGNMGDRNREFDFTVQAQNSEGQPVSVDGTYEGIFVQNGQFKLKHGQSLVIPELPYGVTCTVTESIPEEEGYTTTVKVDGGEEKSSKTVTVENMNTAAVIDFTNTKTLNVPTGIFTDNLPYLMMLAMAAIGLTGFSWRKKRVKKSRDDD
jgi:fibro-slime domain-containing protein